MRTLARCAVVLTFASTLLPLSISPARADRDLREQYGTRSLEVARHIDAAIRLDQAKQPEEAMKEIEPAVAADPACPIAWLWKAEISKDLGDVDGCIEAYKRCVALDAEPNHRSVTTTAKTNLGLLMGQLKRFDESAYWFSRAIVDDSDDHAKEQAKAYRNLALTLHFEGQELAAALAAITGHEIDPDRVEEGLIRDLTSKAAGQEAARVLALEQGGTKVAARAEPAKLKELKVAAIPEKIVRVLADPRGAYVLAIAGGAAHYYVVEPRKDAEPAVRKVETGAAVTTACLAGGKLFVVSGGTPAQVQELDPLTGKAGRSWNVGGAPPQSLAVLPSKNAAFFPVKDQLQRLDLSSGAVTATGLPGQVVTADPAEKYVYARYKEGTVNNDHTVLIDGHPIFIQSDHFDWDQTTLFKYYVAEHALLTAAVRLNAAANGYDVVVSPDGRWVSCPGGGGWRPDAGGGGYSVAVFATADFNQVQKAFALDAYPVGCAFNAVTQQFVGLRNGDAKISHLAGDANKPDVTLAGSFAGPCAWSGDGRYLITARNDTGISVYENSLTADETRLAQTWWKAIAPAGPTDSAKPKTPRAAPQASDALAKFTPAAAPAALRTSVAAALASHATDKPMAWRSLPAYTANAESLAALDEVTNSHPDAGVRIYQFKKALAKDPASVPLAYFTAEAMAASGQAEGAKARYLQVIRADAGRTELSVLSLDALAAIFTKAGQDVAAADCLAHALALDRAAGETVARLVPLLKKLKLNDEADSLSRQTPAAPTAPGAQVPALPAAPAPAAALAPAKVFEAVAPSVVLIRCGRASGTGVCVGRAGLVLTSRHVVAGADNIDVYPFAVENGKTRRLPKLAATLLAQSEADDLALLSVADAPAAMLPLPVADRSPRAGEKVFALGNPGLGRQTLDLSFSEGIVSAPDRVVRGTTYLQHTAAVNPGNSGGPLVNDAGCVVAVVCIKADLAGVSFATPAETIRTFFSAQTTDSPPK